MRRRDFIAALGAAVLPARAFADQPHRPRIMVMMSRGDDSPEERKFVSAFRDALQTLGWADGRNLEIDVVWTALDPDRLQSAVQQVLALQPDVLVTQSTPVTAALMQRTHNIPIVFTNVSDPVGAGFVVSLARPGGNATGFIDLESSMGGKWVEFVQEIGPRATRVVLPYNPATAPKGGSYFLDPIKAAGSAIGIEAVPLPVHDGHELETALAERLRQPDSGLIVIPDAFLRDHADAIVALAALQRVPAVYPSRYYTDIGGLFSYGNDVLDNWQRAADYVDRILRGAKPADLPVQVPVKFEMVVNLKTAKEIGLAISPTLIAQADDVIE